MIQQAIVLLLMLFAIAACSSATAEAPTPQPIAPVEAATEPETEPDTGLPNQPRQLKLKFEVEKPEDLQVVEGDRLQAGQMIALRPGRATLQARLAQLQFEQSQPPALPSTQPQEAAAAREQAQLVLLQAQSRLTTAQAEAERARSLADQGLRPQREADLASIARDQQALQVQVAQQQLKATEQRLQNAIALAQRQDKLRQWQSQQRQLELNSVQAQLDALIVKAPYSGKVRRIRWLEQVGGQVKVEIALQVIN